MEASTNQVVENGSAAPVEPPVLLAVPEITDEDVAAVTRVLRSGWLTTGTECAALEEDLAAYLGAGHVVAVSSCTAALEIALAHLRRPRGSRVGIPAWTFAASALAAVHNGLQPVLLDVDRRTLNLSPASLDLAIDQGLDAVVAVHFGGVPVDRAIHDQCAAAGIPLVEDAAHALGASDDRGMVGGPGTTAACFSFYATKNLTSGEGGALATDDPELAKFARAYRLHGMNRDAWGRNRPGEPAAYDITEPGIKANLPDLLAALARSQLARFTAMQTLRQDLLQRYRQNLDFDGIEFVPTEQHPGSANHLAVVVLPEDADRGVVAGGLRSMGVQTSIHFRPLQHLEWFAKHAAICPGGLPASEGLAPRVLSLPLHVGLTEADVDRVSAALLQVLTG